MCCQDRSKMTDNKRNTPKTGFKYYNIQGSLFYVTFIYSAYQKISSDNKDREEKLYTMLANAQTTINSAVENNIKLASQIEIMQKNIEKLSDNKEFHALETNKIIRFENYNSRCDDKEV